MAQFINPTDYNASIHREILDSLLRVESETYDPQIVEICQNRAIQEMRSYMGKTYDCDTIFSAEGTDRNQLVLMFALDITIYHIFCQHNPYKLSAIRQSRYDRAIEWLKGIQSGDITIDGAPKLDDETLASNSRWQMVSDDIRPTMI